MIHSLYSHKEVFLRELLSNANDALEKLRIVSLTDRNVLSGGETNITIRVDLDEGGKTGKIHIRDTGIGMSKDELARNLGTIARSGTNEFLRRAADGEQVEGSDGNLIGQFGECATLYEADIRSRILLVFPRNPDCPRCFSSSTDQGEPQTRAICLCVQRQGRHL